MALSARAVALGIAALVLAARVSAESVEVEVPLPTLGPGAAETAPAPDPRAVEREPRNRPTDPPPGAGSESPLPSLADGETPRLDPVEERDPRVVRADALLADRATYDEATALYRSYLGEHPEDAAVRLRLARVLAWKGQPDAAIAEYDAVLAADARLSVQVERAETLSWAGRYHEAEAAFDAVLAADPQNGRAARGLARVFLWSGRSHEADRAYVRALEFEEDRDARSEWEGLHALYRPQVRSRVARRSDNDGFRFQSVDAEGTTYLDLRTRVTGEVSYWRTEGEIDLAGGGRDQRSLDGAAYRFGVERHFGPSWLAIARIGHEAWDDAPDQVIANAELRFTPSERASVTLAYEHGGAARPLASFEAALEGVRRNDLALSLWHGLPAGFEVWGRVSGGWLSDSNGRLRGDLSLDYKPLEDRELRVHLASSALRYSDDTDVYYDPDLDVDNEIGVTYVQPLWFHTRARIEAAAGYGISREAGRTSDGFQFRTGSYLWWEWRRWAFEVGGTFGQSRRDNVYRSHFFTASISRSF